MTSMWIRPPITGKYKHLIRIPWLFALCIYYNIKTPLVLPENRDCGVFLIVASTALNDKLSLVWTF